MIQVYITSARRAYASPTTTARRGAYVVLGGLHVTSLPDEAAAHADTIFLGPGEDTWPRFLADFRRGRAGARLPVDGAHARGRAADPARPDQAAALPRAQLDRRLARLPARLRLLLQGGVLRGRPVASTRRRWTRRSPRSSACPAGTSTSSTTTCSATDASRRRSSTACAAWAGSGRRRAPSTRCWRPDLLEKAVGVGPAQPVRRLRDARTRRTSSSSTSTRTCAATTRAAIRRLHDLGVMVNGSFVFGMDGDDESVFERTVEWADRAGHRDRDVPHPDAVSRHGALPAHGRRRGASPPTTGISTTRGTRSSGRRA